MLGIGGIVGIVVFVILVAGDMIRKSIVKKMAENDAARLQSMEAHPAGKGLISE